MSDRGTRKWVFTLNNYNEEEVTQLHSEFLSKGNKFICEKEIGESGTPHLQGYVMFKNSRNLNTLKKINNKIHWEVAKGNVEQNKKYCSKEDNVIFEKDMFEDIVEPLDIRINKIFEFEIKSRREVYEQFMEESDRTMDGWAWLESHLREKIGDEDRIRYNRE